MSREQLVAEAREAGKNAIHNLKWIQKHPEAMLPGKIGEGEAYLIMMKRFAEEEMKKDRRPGQSRLRTRLKSLLSSILSSDPQKSKEETA